MFPDIVDGVRGDDYFTLNLRYLERQQEVICIVLVDQMS